MPLFSARNFGTGSPSRWNPECLNVGMGRDWRVDTLRGYFLVAMTLGHFPNPLAPFTEYTFGYASSPDAFVFLSGLVSTWVYLPILQKRGPSAMVAKVRRRVGTIYLTHIGLLVLGILVVLQSGGGHRIAIAGKTFVLGALLWNQVGFDRILPMYCVFLAFTPLVVKQFVEGRAWLVGFISTSLWLGAQFGLGEWRSAASNPATFNLCAWQAYFVVGQYLAYRGLQSQEGNFVKSRVVFGTVALVAALLMVDRHLLWLWGANPLLRFNPHPDHNPVRFLDAACLGYLIWRIPRAADLVVMKLRFFRFLNLLGRHSLQVFALSMVVARFEAHTIADFSWSGKLIAAVLTVLSLGLPAWLHQLYRDRVVVSPVVSPEMAPVRPAA